MPSARCVEIGWAHPRSSVSCVNFMLHDRYRRVSAKRSLVRLTDDFAVRKLVREPGRGFRER